MKWWEEKEGEGKCLATVSVARLLQHFAMQKSKRIVCSWQHAEGDVVVDACCNCSTLHLICNLRCLLIYVIKLH